MAGARPDWGGGQRPRLGGGQLPPPLPHAGYGPAYSVFPNLFDFKRCFRTFLYVYFNTLFVLVKSIRQVRTGTAFSNFFDFKRCFLYVYFNTLFVLVKSIGQVRTGTDFALCPQTIHVY